MTTEEPEGSRGGVTSKMPAVAAQSPPPEVDATRASALSMTTSLGWSGDEDRAEHAHLNDRTAEAIDRSLHFLVSCFTMGISPMAITQAYFDWLVHLAGSPGKIAQLQQKALSDSIKLARYVAFCLFARPDAPAAPRCVTPPDKDRRFTSDAWNLFPFNAIHQIFLLQEQWWHAATTDIRGVSPHHARVMEFLTRQLLDVFSPSNFLATNPEVIEKTQIEGGQNLVRGFVNILEDVQRTITRQPPAGMDHFKVGVDVALTQGKIVYRNRLIELIQYTASTGEVHPQPVLFIPAWIMKYYILDLSPHNSLVKFLRDQGFTVFMISWKNPGPEDRDLGMEDYYRLGVMEALNAISAIMPGLKVHGAGYCLGGTLLSMAAAAMARDGDSRFASLSLFAAQSDFTEAGELTLFTSESQVAFLEDMMWQQGYLDSTQMAGAFQMLRSSDLIWSRMVRDYLMGERQQLFDLMAWNADSTRMPCRMHSEYLRHLFLDNDLAEGRFKLDDRAVALSDIRQPIFAVGTESDHVSPWRSVFKVNLLTEGEVTFVLTSGGHNAGIVSEPGHAGRHYRVATKRYEDRYVDPDTWQRRAIPLDGSWWLEWRKWLAMHSDALSQPPPVGFSHGRALEDAPGSYVLQR